MTAPPAIRPRSRFVGRAIIGACAVTLAAASLIISPPPASAEPPRWDNCDLPTWDEWFSNTNRIARCTFMLDPAKEPFTPAEQKFTFTVPPFNVTEIVVTAIGGKGGKGGNGIAGAVGGSGGLGAQVTSRFMVKPHEQLTVIVGRSAPELQDGRIGGAGGDATEIRAADESQLIIAAGGGGGGAAGSGQGDGYRGGPGGTVDSRPDCVGCGTAGAAGHGGDSASTSTVPGGSPDIIASPYRGSAGRPGQVAADKAAELCSRRSNASGLMFSNGSLPL